MSANGFNEMEDDVAIRRADALVCLVQAVDVLTAVVGLDTSPADETGTKAIEQVRGLIGKAQTLLGIRRTEGD
jgi:hypothetical protein